MQFIDIAVASGYAAVCLSLIVLMNPVAPREAAVEAAAQSTLDSAISAYVHRVGLPFLTTSSEAAICRRSWDSARVRRNESPSRSGPPATDQKAAP